MEMRLSRYGAASTRPAPVNRMMADFATDFRDGVDINLGVGYVNEATIPEAQILEAMRTVAAQRTQYRQAFNYGGPQGSPNLIASIRRFLLRRYDGRLDEATLARREIIIGPSGATSLLEAIADVLAPGLVVTGDPMYYIYTNTLERKGFEILAVPEDSDGLNPDALERQLLGMDDAVNRVSFFYFVTVNNPTCSILSNARRHALAALAARLSREQHRLIPIFFDQAYELLIHDPAVEAPESALRGDDMGVVYEIGTLSKILAPALRIGYMAGAPGPFLRAMVQKTSDVGFSAPLIMQEAASLLLDEHIAGQITRVNTGYRDKARAVGRAIQDCLGPHLESISGGQAGFYYYLGLRDVETHEQSPFFRYLTRTTGDPAIDGPAQNPHPRVIYIPGEHCVHPRGALVAAGRRQFRLSYGFEETGAIVRALGIMREAAAYAATCR